MSQENISLVEVQVQAHEIAKAHGFWDESPLVMWNNVPLTHDVELVLSQKLALIHSEVSEALEELRDGTLEAFTEELTDIVIRVADLAGALKVDLSGSVTAKLEKNKQREFKHGKRF